MRTRTETLHIDLQTLETLERELMSEEHFDWFDKVPDDIQSEIRMLFNEALAGGVNMNGDGGPTLSHSHALDCVWAAKKIFKLELERYLK